MQLIRFTKYIIRGSESQTTKNNQDYPILNAYNLFVIGFGILPSMELAIVIVRNIRKETQKKLPSNTPVDEYPVYEMGALLYLWNERNKVASLIAKLDELVEHHASPIMTLKQRPF